MKGDFSRFASPGEYAYSRVLMQQGRLQTDADLNAQAEIQAKAQAEIIRDLLGPAGGASDAGFRIRGHMGLVFHTEHPGAVIEHSTTARLSGHSYTVEGWIRRKPGSGFGEIVVCRGAGREGGGGFHFGVDEGGRLTFKVIQRLGRAHAGRRDTIETFEAVDLVGAAIVPEDRFIHVAAVVRDDVVRLFVNGRLDVERAVGARTAFDAAPAHVGMGFPGAIDGLHLWRAAFGPELMLLRAQGDTLFNVIDIEPEWRLSDLAKLMDAARRRRETFETVEEDVEIAAAEQADHRHARGVHHAVAGPSPTLGEAHLSICAGRYYIDGLPSAMRRTSSFTDQPDLPGAALPPLSLRERHRGPYLAYLESTEVVVTAQEDAGLQDTAFGLADTALRLQTLSRVRLSVASDLAELDAGRPSGALRFQRIPGRALGEPRLIRVEVHDAGYASPTTYAELVEGAGFALHSLTATGRAVLGDRTFGDDGLWRVDRPIVLIHESGEEKFIHGRVRGHELGPDGRVALALALEAPLPAHAPEHPKRWRIMPISTVKWSADNGAFAAKLLSIEADALQLTVPNLTERSEALYAGDHLEVTDEETTLRLALAPLRRVVEADLNDDESALCVTLAHPATDPLGREPDARLAHRPLVRRWDGIEHLTDRGGLAKVHPFEALRLGGGVEVQFGPGFYCAGAAWTCPVRDDRLDWPSDAEGEPRLLPAQHGVVRRAELAHVWFHPTEVSVKDLRRTFSPLARRRPSEHAVVIDEGLFVVSEEGAEEEVVGVSFPTEEVDDLGGGLSVELAEEFGLSPLPSDACAFTRTPDAGGGWRFTGAQLAVRHPAHRWIDIDTPSDIGRWIGLIGLTDRIALLTEEHLWLYEPGARTWERRRSPEVSGLNAAAMSAVDGRLHIMGVENSSVQGWHFAYDMAADDWSTLTPSPKSNRKIALAAMGGKLYAAGGLHSVTRRPSDSFEVYHPEEDRWEPRPALPHPTSHAALAASAGRLYLFGGTSGGVLGRRPATTDRTVVYSPSLDRWSPGPTLRVPRHGAVAVATEDRLHLLGGSGDDHKSPPMESLDVGATAWVEAVQPVGRGDVAAASLSGALYLVSREPRDDGDFRLEACAMETVLYLHEPIAKTRSFTAKGLGMDPGDVTS